MTENLDNEDEAELERVPSKSQLEPGSSQCDDRDESDDTDLTLRQWNWRSYSPLPQPQNRPYYRARDELSGGDWISRNYLDEASRYSLINHEEEIKLAERIKTGDKNALMKLVLANLRLVIKFASRYRNRGLDFEDLIQEGNLGLMRAAQLYDPDKGTRFSTYASMWIIQFISRAVDNKSRSIRLPVNLHQDIRTLRQMSATIERQRGYEPTTEELARLTNLSVGRIRTALNAVESMISLNQRASQDIDAELGEQIAGSDSSDVESQVERQLSKKWVAKLLNSLSESELNIISLRYGLDGSDGLPFPQICQQTGLSPGTVKNLHQVALRKLRRKVQSLGKKTSDIEKPKGLYAI